MYQKFFKGLIDRILALALLVVLSPLILILSIISKFKEPKGTIFFRQVRSGKDRKDFICYKFRTMKMDAPANLPTWEIKNPDEIISSYGKFLRKSSLDELPQLVNILKGDMSFIGPRPVIPKEKELLDLREKYGATKVKPGMTGLAQISGRDKLGPKQKAKADGYYASHVTFLNDFKLFFRTIPAVVKSEGVEEGSQDFAEDDEKKG